jgi:hypothetical protein
MIHTNVESGEANCRLMSSQGEHRPATSTVTAAALVLGAHGCREAALYREPIGDEKLFARPDIRDRMNVYPSIGFDGLQLATHAWLSQRALLPPSEPSMTRPSDSPKRNV